MQALTVYPLQQDSDKAYPHFDVTSGFIVATDPCDEDLDKGVIIPCVKEGRWYFKGRDKDKSRGNCAVAWHENEDDASQPHTGGAYSALTSTFQQLFEGNIYYLEQRMTYAEMVDIYIKQKCLISQIIQKGNIPSQLCEYITQFIVYHPHDKRYFTNGCTDDGWHTHTDVVNITHGHVGLFDAGKYRDCNKLHVQNVMSAMELHSSFKERAAKDLWREIVKNTSDCGHPVSLPNGMCVRCMKGTAAIQVRYNKNDQCVGVRFFFVLYEDTDDDSYVDLADQSGCDADEYEYWHDIDGHSDEYWHDIDGHSDFQYPHNDWGVSSSFSSDSTNM